MPKMGPGHAGWIWWAHQGHNLPLMCTLLQRAVVLASPIPGSMSIGWWATWLTHKQLKYMKSRHPDEPWMHTAMMNKEWTLPSMFNIPTPQGGTRIAKTKSLWPNLLKPKPELISPVLCINPFIFPPNLHKQYDSDVMKWCLDCLLPHLGGKSPCVCTVESCQLACASANIPNPSPPLISAQATT